jgi:transposase
MSEYVGLDVSQRETSICVIDAAGHKVWQGRCPSTPEAIAVAVRERAPAAVRVGMETGPLAVWHWHGLRAAGVPVVCLHARQAAAALALQANKTDDNDAFGLAQLVRSGWYRPVQIKSLESHGLRAMLTARAKLVGVRTGLTNTIRGLCKTFGVVLGPGRNSSFTNQVREALTRQPKLAPCIEPLLLAWECIRVQMASLEKQLARHARHNAVCRRLSSVPGVGVLTAIAFVTAIDDPSRFHRATDVGAYLGLTPRRYQSGEVDRAGRISKRGDRLTRSLLYEAANVLLTRWKASAPLKLWADALRARVGWKKARVGLARKLAVLLYRLWVDGTTFNQLSVVRD